MAQPAPYSRQFDFTDYATLHPDDPYNASQHDAELDAIEVTLDGILANIAQIQRDDLMLANGSVHPDSLSTATKALIASDWTPRGAWVTATAYVVGDVVEQTEVSYVCAVAHTSGTFATDRTAGKWIILGSAVSGGASSVTFSPTGTIAATDVQSAIAEVASEALQKSSNLSDVASLSTSRDNLSVPARADLQIQAYTAAAAGGTANAITAAYTPTVSSLTNRMRLSFVAATANTSTTPTFTPASGSITAKTIVKGANAALAVGDIAGQHAVCVVEYNETLDKWVLLNPASSVNAMPTTGGTFTGDAVFDTGAQIFLDDSITAAGASLPLCFEGDADTGLYRPAANTLMLATNALDRLELDANGNVTVKTSGGKIKGDFSNATHSSRILFQTTSANSATNIGAYPSGTGTAAAFIAYQGNGADLAAGNYSFGSLTHNTGTDTRIESGKAGSGTYYPLTFYTGGAVALTLSTAQLATFAGNVVASGVGPHAIGGAVSTNAQLFLTGLFNTGTGAQRGLLVSTTLGPAANQSAFTANIAGTINEASAGTHTDFSSLQVEPPTIAGAGAALTNATTLKVTGPPSGATNNRAFWVVSGDVDLGGLVVGAGGDLGIAALAKIFLDGTARTGNTYIQESAADTISLFCNASERVKVTSTTLLLQGIATLSAQNNAAAVSISNTHASNPFGLAVVFDNAAPDNNTEYFLSCADNAGVRCRIYSDGDLQNHDNSYGALSDARLKTAIRDAGSQLEDFRRYRFRNYKLKDDVKQYGSAAKEQIGLIAQEVLPISPGLVLDHRDHYGLQYSVLAVKNAKATQELVLRTDHHEEEIARLTRENVALRAACEKHGILPKKRAAK